MNRDAHDARIAKAKRNLRRLTTARGRLIERQAPRERLSRANVLVTLQARELAAAYRGEQ